MARDEDKVNTHSFDGGDQNGLEQRRPSQSRHHMELRKAHSISSLRRRCNSIPGTLHPNLTPGAIHMTPAPSRNEWDKGLSQLTPLQLIQPIQTPVIPSSEIFQTPVLPSSQPPLTTTLPSSKPRDQDQSLVDELATLRIAYEELKKDYLSTVNKVDNVITRISSLKLGHNKIKAKQNEQ